MRKLFLFVVVLAIANQAQTTKPKSTAKTAAKPVVTVATPDKINWVPVPPNLPPGAQVAVLAGNPAAPGPFVMRLKFPDGYKVMPHWHPVPENVTVLSGEFRVAMGDTWDDSKLQSLPAGSFVSVPIHHSHYAMAKGATEIQVHGTGPFKLVYVNPNDDPSKKK
ncbi:MAG TPA: cupin domain-containing protein [Candidatus Angelobacter sp.]|jgi:quercetin dioxygenase-like cupin family protein|nr:cupin domain-containing protein [Candidatus Angelobacter sp.]